MVKTTRDDQHGMPGSKRKRLSKNDQENEKEPQAKIVKEDKPITRHGGKGGKIKAKNERENQQTMDPETDDTRPTNPSDKVTMGTKGGA